MTIAELFDRGVQSPLELPQALFTVHQLLDACASRPERTLLLRQLLSHSGDCEDTTIRSAIIADAADILHDKRDRRAVMQAATDVAGKVLLQRKGSADIGVLTRLAEVAAKNKWNGMLARLCASSVSVFEPSRLGDSVHPNIILAHVLNADPAAAQHFLKVFDQWTTVVPHR